MEAIYRTRGPLGSKLGLLFICSSVIGLFCSSMLDTGAAAIVPQSTAPDQYYTAKIG